MKTTVQHRAALALEAYIAVVEGTESFEEDNIGAFLSYLMGAILRGEATPSNSVGLTLEDESAPEFVHVLRKAFPDPKHSVWSYVRPLSLDMVDFPEKFKNALITGDETIMGESEDYPAIDEWFEALAELSALDK